MAAAIEFFRSAPANLAARCLGDCSGWREDNLIRRCTGDVVCYLLSAGFQHRARISIGLTGLGQHDHPLGAGLSIGDTKHRYAAFADTGNLSDGFFDFCLLYTSDAADE